jgi:hypothetical protein
MSKVVDFFATRTDLLDLLGHVDVSLPIHYVEAGMFDKPTLTEYVSASQIPNLGTTKASDSNTGERFLLAYRSTPFLVRPVPQKRGGVRFAIDQQANPDTVAFASGGQFDGRTIVSGYIGSCSNSDVSAELFRTLASLIRQRWSKIRSYSVGPEAVILLDSGGRLTANQRSSREYDLQR